MGGRDALEHALGAVGEDRTFRILDDHFSSFHSLREGGRSRRIGDGGHGEEEEQEHDFHH